MARAFEEGCTSSRLDPATTAHGARETKETPVKNDSEKPGPEPQHEPIACMECGAILPLPPPPADPAGTSHATRITCPRCGRINDIAEAEAADLHRQRPHSSA